MTFEDHLPQKIPYCIIFTHSQMKNRKFGRPKRKGWDNTGCFKMFSVITNIYNKKTKGPTLMELFTATRKLKKYFLQQEMFDLCTTGDMAHIDKIFKLLPHTRQHVDACVATTIYIYIVI